MTARRDAHPERRTTPTWRIACLPATAVMLVLLVTANRYGFHGDELYFRMLPPAWWYDDQPPLTVWLAHVCAAVSDAVWVQRLPAILAAGAGVFLASLFPRLLGHGPRVQRVAAWAHGFTVYPLLMGHVMLTASLDLLAWQAVLLGVVAALVGRRHGLAWAGLVAGVACWNKLLVLVLVAAVFVALLTCARWLLRTWDAWLGAVACLAIGGFQVAAQLTHSLPMLAVSRDLATRSGSMNRLLALPLLLVFVGPPFALVCWRGLMWRPTGRATGRRGGPVLLVTATLVLVFALVSAAQPYYAVPAFLPALALGWGTSARDQVGVWRDAPRVIVANALVAALLCFPLVPASTPAFSLVSTLDPVARDQVGWPGLAAQMASARGASDAAVVTDSYALAGALARFGPSRGVTRDRLASGANALWSLGPPAQSEVLLVGRTYAAKRVLFAQCTDAGVLRPRGSDPFGVVGTPMLRCRDPRGGWASVWPQLRRRGV